MKPTFEESLSQIDYEIYKRKPKWTLTAVAWMDFEDVAQIIRLHIYKKWNMYNEEKPLLPWLNRIISNQIKNLLRNLYLNHCRPCLRCAAAEGDTCRIYGSQCAKCQLFAHWITHKKRAFDVKLPVALEFHEAEVHDTPYDNLDIEASAEKIHEHMLSILKPFEKEMYSYLFIEQLTDEEIAKKMEYKTKEKKRSAGYKAIGKIRKLLIEKVKKNLKNKKIDVNL